MEKSDVYRPYFPITVSSRSVLLRNIKENKSTGLLNMPARVLEDGCNILAKPLTELMKRSLAESSIPAEWKHQYLNLGLKLILQITDLYRY